MASNEITIPTFDFTAFYYPEVLEALLAFKRINCPELTEESPQEPTIQFMRAFALVAHLNNSLIDMVANESTLPTAKLVESVRNHLRLINYELSAATPAQVDMVYELSRTFAGSRVIVPIRAQVGTRRDTVTPSILYEADAELTVTDTATVGYASSQDGEANTIRTTAVNSAAGGDDFQPWSGAAQVNDALYIGHNDVMFDRVDLVVQTPGAGYGGVWEFYDADFLDSTPDSATVQGAGVRLILNGWLGAVDQTGRLIRVTLASTGAHEDAVVQYASGSNFVDIGALGQSSPSLAINDYSVGSDWSPLTVTADTTNGLSSSGNVQFALPQNEDQHWRKWTTPEGASAWVVRFRVSTAGGSPPTIRTMGISEGKQYVLRQCTQGRSVSEVPLGSSTGLPDQSFKLANKNHINGTQVITVNDEVWTEVPTFLVSQPGSKHYVVRLSDDDTANILFGSGKQGAIPPVGANNIAAPAYRVDAVDNGNVGPNTIVVDKTGLSFVAKVWNPRQAVGWSQAEGATPESLEKAKVDGPARLRIIEVALGPNDVETLSASFVDASGARPVSRAFVIEEGLGPKTMQLMVVAKGGGQLTEDQLRALDRYYNGDASAVPPIKKKIVSNQEVTSFNYSERRIDVTATVYTTASEEAITSALKVLLQPESKRDNGTYNWNFGGEVPLTRLNAEIFNAGKAQGASTTKVELTSPASDIQLGALELPRHGTISIRVVRT